MPRSRRHAKSRPAPAKKPSPVKELIAVCDEILAVGRGHDNPKTLQMCLYRKWEPTGEKLDELARRAYQLVKVLDADYQTENFYWQDVPRTLSELYPKAADIPEREFRQAREQVRRLNPRMSEAKIERIAAMARALAERSIAMRTKPQWPGGIKNLDEGMWFFCDPQLLERFEDRFEGLKIWARQFAQTAVADTSGDGAPFYKPKYFRQWDIDDELLRRNAITGKQYTEGKVRRIKKKPASGKGKRAVYWYSEPDARRRWPDLFKIAEDDRTRETSKPPTA